MQLGKTTVTAMCFSLLLAGADVRSAHAQAIHEGKVIWNRDERGRAALPGATVEISSPTLLAGKRTATTSARGTFVLLNVPPGLYRLSVSRDAFKTVVREDVVGGKEIFSPEGRSNVSGRFGDRSAAG